MTTDASRVSVRILEKEYHVACPAEERAALLNSAEYLNGKMREIRDSGKVVGHERIAIMAALNIAHELLAVRVGGGFDIGELKRRMNSMAAALDAAMSSQNELF